MNDKKKTDDKKKLPGVFIGVLLATLATAVPVAWLLGSPAVAGFFLLLGMAVALLVVASIFIRAMNEPREPKK